MNQAKVYKNPVKKLCSTKQAVKEGKMTHWKNVVNAYVHGKGLKYAPERALHICKKVMSREAPEAYCVLGDLYKEGLGTQQNSKEALKHYKLALEHGYEPTWFKYCDFILRGFATRQEEKQAFRSAHFRA